MPAAIPGKFAPAGKPEPEKPAQAERERAFVDLLEHQPQELALTASATSHPLRKTSESS
jgi:hypothetical protein